MADFHIHSRYSRATSHDMDLEALDKWAKIKGIKVLGTGDFTHPEWLKNLKEKLRPAEPGLFKLAPNRPEHQRGTGEGLNSYTRFILTSEISCIYSKTGKVRKIHIIVFAPSFEIVDQINASLNKIGNLKSDGRPILGLDAKELAKIVLEISKDCLVVPAHAWTPWFSIFGSKSGFNSIEECFGEYSKYIYAIETGLSSDPLMNWQLSALDKIALISNSDAHSPQKIGREANVFDTELSYQGIIDAIKEKNLYPPTSAKLWRARKILYTVEFFPAEGKNHFDGHRACGISLSPEESKKYNNICPNCGRPLVIGVLNRVAELADRPFDAGHSAELSRSHQGKPEGAIPFKSLVPLVEIISEVLGHGVGTKEVVKQYQNLTDKLGSEFDILLKASAEDLKKATLPEIAEGIIRVREGKISVEPGYDGVYGKVHILDKIEGKKPIKQGLLF